MSPILRCAVFITVMLCSVSVFSHQFLPTQSKLSLESNQAFRLTTELDMIEMIQQVLNVQAESQGVFSAMPSARDDALLIEKVRQLPEEEIARALALIQSNILSRIEMKVEEQVTPLTVRLLPSASFVKGLLAQPPQYTEYRIPVYASGQLPKGHSTIKIKFPSELGKVKLSIPDASGMLVMPENFSLPITVSYSEKLSVEEKATEAKPTVEKSTAKKFGEKKTVEEMGLEEMGLEKMGVEEMGVEEKTPSKTGVKSGTVIKEEAALAQPQPSISVTPTLFAQVTTYCYQGILHIVPKGLDHILFVIALFLLSTQLKPLLLQVTVFTLAHTITLLLAGYQVIQVPAHIYPKRLNFRSFSGAPFYP